MTSSRVQKGATRYRRQQKNRGNCNAWQLGITRISAPSAGSPALLTPATLGFLLLLPACVADTIVNRCADSASISACWRDAGYIAATRCAEEETAMDFETYKRLRLPKPAETAARCLKPGGAGGLCVGKRRGRWAICASLFAQKHADGAEGPGRMPIFNRVERRTFRTARRLVSAGAGRPLRQAP